MKSFAELDKKICSCTDTLNAKLDGSNGKRAILLCGGTGCISSNSMDIKAAFEKLVAENADLIISSSVLGKSMRFCQITTIQPARKKVPITGTSQVQTPAIFLAPPMITSPVSIPAAIPITCGEISACSLIAAAMECACTLLPAANAAMIAKTENSTASFLRCSTLSNMYIGPPARLPSSLFTRNLAARQHSA